jgi:anti-sigma regulatory factor (Ser/Thr protein kinase)
MAAESSPKPLPAVQIPLPSSDQAPGQARRLTQEALVSWCAPALVESVVLVVSELVTNAIRYGSPPVYLVLRRGSQDLRVDVHDSYPEGPAEGSVGPGDSSFIESGRGLVICRAVADEVGWESVPGDGKLVYACFQVAAA